jgi:hypothetical protein
MPHTCYCPHEADLVLRNRGRDLEPALEAEAVVLAGVAVHHHFAGSDVDHATGNGGLGDLGTSGKIFRGLKVQIEVLAVHDWKKIVWNVLENNVASNGQIK